MSLKKEKNSEHPHAGRPIVYDEEMLTALADSLDAWSKTDEATNIKKWICNNDINPSRLSEWAKQSSKFSEALNKAKLRVALNREELAATGELNFGVYNRYQGMYDSMLLAHEEHVEEHKAKARAAAESKSAQPVTINVVDYSKAPKSKKKNDANTSA